MPATPNKWPVFLCYRQVDGSDVADRLATMLDGQLVEVLDSESNKKIPHQLVVYQDKNAITSGDWTQAHRANLARSRAIIVVCTPAASIDHRKKRRQDWVHHEIDWWLENRPEIAPILVDALGTNDLYIPDQILDKWPNAQRTLMVESDWAKLSEIELTSETRRITDLIKREVTRSRQEFIAQELAEAAVREKKLKRRFVQTLVAATVAVAMMITAVVAFLQSRNNEKIAIEARQLARENELVANKAKSQIDNLISRVNIGLENPYGVKAMQLLCKEATSVTKQIASQPEQTQNSALQDRFLQLYYGGMNIVELRQSTEEYNGNVKQLKPSSIEAAMVNFRNALVKVENSNNAIENRLALPTLAEAVETECRRFLY